MFERMSPPPNMEETKQPELAQINIAEESRVTPWVDCQACDIMGITNLELLQFKR